MNKLIIALLGLLLCGMASATLPPLSAEAQAKAALAKSKAEWSTKVASYHLCLAQNKTVDRYLQKHNKPKPEVNFPPCLNPGPYVPPPAQALSTDTQVKSKK